VRRIGLVAAAILITRPAAAQPAPGVAGQLAPSTLGIPPEASGAGRIEITVTPKGEPWSVGGHGGFECDPTCTLRLLPSTYAVTIGPVTETLPLQVATDISFDPGVPRLRTIGGWTAVGTAAVGGVFLGIGAWGLLNACVGTGKCPDGLNVSRPVAEGLVIGAAGLISVSVAGAIVFAVSGQSIRVRELAPVPEPRRHRPVDVVLRPTPRGAGVEFVQRF
jgi:hypothetical protein